MAARDKRHRPPVAITKVCPACNTAGPVRLYDGQVCAACQAQQAWSALGDGGRLVIDRASIEAAARRRAGEAAGEPAWRKALIGVAPAVTLALAGLTAWSLAGMFAPRELGPLRALIDDLASSARQTMVLGLAALAIAIGALVRLRSGRHFRRIPILASHLVAVVVGVAGVLTGGAHWLFEGGGSGQYTAMPARASLGASAQAERIVNATVVVLAPDADGDARNLALGAGAVVAADAGRAWIVTCSHVAMPYVAVAAFRRPRDARPVWVQLSDGREGQAMIRWTAPPPLDVALLELPIANPPEPVTIAPDTSTIQAPASVTFVPNPYRSGWKLLHGELLRRERHRTPAGTYDLLYTDLPVTFGDSGSGLYDARGQFIGLNTWTRITGIGPSQGISLPSETMRVLVDAIRDGKLDQLDETVLPVPAARGAGARPEARPEVRPEVEN